MATAESRLEAVLLVRACLLPAAAVPPVVELAGWDWEALLLPSAVTALLLGCS